MPRADRLALTLNDLVVLSNRGLVRRAQQELQSGELTFELQEDDAGTVTFRWSDGPECVLPWQRVVGEGRCNCAAVTICRHLIRSVLAYRQSAAAPGFVPGDIRYTHCDCAEAAPCRQVPLVVWAFRMLAADQVSGLISTRKIPSQVPASLLDEVEQALGELAGVGIAGAPSTLIDRHRRLEARCRDEGLIWPAEILAEIVQQLEAYVKHDARFSPLRVAELVGELCLRGDAIRSDTGAVPQLFLRGASSDRVTEVRSGRMIGLGCEVQIQRSGVEIASYLQDPDLGAVVAVSRNFPDPPKEAADPPRAFWELARTPVIRGIPLTSLGIGQLLIKGGKRTPAGRFIPGRAEASLQPQSFQWEGLRSPLLAESFAELRARLAALPPASFRPRRLAENLCVCPVASVPRVQFDPAEQQVRAILQDAEGTAALLVHPYTSRGREGAEVLLGRLQHQPEALRFVAGRVRLQAAGLVVAPLTLVFQDENSRTALQPWVDRANRAEGATPVLAHSGPPSDPIARSPGQIMEALGELLLLGLDRADATVTRYWQELCRYGGALGFVRFLDPMYRLIDALEQKSHTSHWDWRPAARWTLHLAALAHLAQEEALG